MKWKELIHGLHQEESGQDLLEYVLVLGIVLVAVVTGSESVATLIGDGVTKLNAKILSIVQ